MREITLSQSLFKFLWHPQLFQESSHIKLSMERSTLMEALLIPSITRVLSIDAEKQSQVILKSLLTAFMFNSLWMLKTGLLEREKILTKCTKDQTRSQPSHQLTETLLRLINTTPQSTSDTLLDLLRLYLMQRLLISSRRALLKRWSKKAFLTLSRFSLTKLPTTCRQSRLKLSMEFLMIGSLKLLNPTGNSLNKEWWIDSLSIRNLNL